MLADKLAHQHLAANVGVHTVNVKQVVKTEAAAQIDSVGLGKKTAARLLSDGGRKILDALNP